MSDSAQSSNQRKGEVVCINTDTGVQGFHSFHSSMLQLYTLNYYTSLSYIGYTSAVVPGFRYSQTKNKNTVNKLKNNQHNKKKSKVMAYGNDRHVPLMGKVQLVTRVMFSKAYL